MTEAILNDLSDNVITSISNEIKELQENIAVLENNKNELFDLDGNKLTSDDLKNYKKVAKILFKKGLFSKKDNVVKCEFISQ